MKTIFLIQTILIVAFCQYYDCLSKAFQATCKKPLYECTNNPECSYQLHQNTQHIFLDKTSAYFPSLYFSNPKAVVLYECLQKACQLPPIDQKYPSTLPFDSCLLELYDLCGGDIENIYKNPASQTAEAGCYRKYCSFPKEPMKQ